MCFSLRRSGTASYPRVPHGWQRDKREMVSQKPRQAPFLSIASMAYSEQVGLWLLFQPTYGFKVQR